MGELNNAKRFRLNSICSLIYTVLLLLSGFVLPKLILSYFGSSINGLVNSITQFLQVFSLLELGVATVTKSCLYKSVAINDKNETNRIISSATSFYKKIGLFLVLYVVFIIVLYPNLINTQYGIKYTSILIIAHSVSLFAQYYFGIVDTCILDAYQDMYVFYIVQSVSLILNIIISYLLIVFGFDIYIVKVMTAIIYVFRPIIIRLYINRKYTIVRNEVYSDDPIKQKWNGVAQHISFIVLQSTDTIILSAFSSLELVSVYSVYNLVLTGIVSILTAAITNVPSVLGHLYESNRSQEFKQYFSKINLLFHCLISIIFGVTMQLIIPFVLLYTKNVNDIAYAQPVFSAIITIANAMFCYRLPYVVAIQSVGGYKDTQWIFAIAAAINLMISISMVSKFGIIGIAVGTLVAMIYQTFALAVYCKNKVYKQKFNEFIKVFILDYLELVVIFVITSRFSFTQVSILEWLELAVKDTLIASCIVIIIQLVFNKKNFLELIDR